MFNDFSLGFVYWLSAISQFCLRCQFLYSLSVNHIVGNNQPCTSWHLLKDCIFKVWIIIKVFADIVVTSNLTVAQRKWLFIYFKLLQSSYAFFSPIDWKTAHSNNSLVKHSYSFNFKALQRLFDFTTNRDLKCHLPIT